MPRPRRARRAPRVVGEDVGGAVLEPEQVARRRLGGRGLDVRPKPSCDQRMRARPNAMRLRLRIACTATCGSSAHAWMHRSPSDAAGSRSSPRNAGSRSSSAGRCAAMPKRSTPSSSNSVGPKPNVMVRLLAGRPSASPVSSGGASGEPPTAPVALTSSPWVIRAAAYVQSCSSEIEVVAVGARHHVERREVQVVLHRRRDARPGGRRRSRRRMPRPPRLRRAPDRDARRRRRRRRRREARRTGAEREPSRPRRASSAPARSPDRSRARRGMSVASRHSRTVTVSCDSGSARALIRSVNSRLSASVSSRVVDEAVRERAVRGEGGLERRRIRRRSRSTSAAPSSPFDCGEVADERERHLRALDVGGEVPEVGARPPVLLAGDLAGGDLVEQRDRAVAEMPATPCASSAVWKSAECT